MNASENLYRLLLRLYPRRHREAYGEQMAVHFRDQLREARDAGVLPVARLWLLIVADAALTILAEHRAQIQEGWMKSMGKELKPLPWWQIILIVLPGMFFLLRYVLNDLPVLIGFIVSIIALGINWRRDRKFPGWGLLLLGFFTGMLAILVTIVLGPNWRWSSVLQSTLIVLGIALSMGINAVLFFQHARMRGIPATAWLIFGVMFLSTLLIAFIEVRSSTPLTGLPMLALTLMYLVTYLGWLLALTVPIALGLPLARRYGLTAVLFVIGCLNPVYGGFLDPAEGLGFFMGPPVLVWIARLIFLAAALVVAPLWSMRARTPHWRKLGLLIPISVSLFAAAILAGILRDVDGWDNWLRDGLVTFTIFLLFALAVSLYGAAQVEAPTPEEARAIPAEAV